jgi:hypothetical protein
VRAAATCLRWLVLLVAVAFVDAPLGRGLPLGDDTELHLYRLVDLDHLIRQGILYSRWQPDLVYGYGSPLFSFYAPLSAYLAELGHLAGLPLRSGLALEFAVLPLIAGGATHLFLRRRVAEGPALLGGIAYLTGATLLYNVYVRGSVSDALAMSLFPVVLLALDRLAERPGPRRASGLALVLAALLLSHDVSGPLVLPLHVLCGLWWSRGNRAALAWSGLGMGLGVGLAAFFLGPAAFEASATRVSEFLDLGDLSYDKNFVPFASLLAPFATAHPGAVLTQLPIGLGLVPVVLGLAAVVAAPRLNARLRGEVAIFALALVVAAGLALPVSGPIWERVSLLHLVQLPWRFLAVAGFANALLIGYAAEGLTVRQGKVARMACPAAGAVVLATLAVPYLYPLSGANLPTNPNLAQVTAFQRRTSAFGVTANSEFLPRGLERFPPAPPFDGADRGAGLGEKLDLSSVPEGTVLRRLDDAPLATRLDVTSPLPFVARFFVFRFLGWSATLDGQPVSLAAPGPYNTLTVPVPAGRHTLDLAFGETRPRLGFDLLSLVSALAILGICVGDPATREGIGRSRGRQPMEAAAGAPDLSRVLAAAKWEKEYSTPAAGVLLVAMILMMGLKWSVFDRLDTPLVKRFDGERPPGMQVAARHQFGRSVDLLGYSLDPPIGHPGRSENLTLYWTETTAPPLDYSSFVHILNARGDKVAQEDNTHPADLPMSRWLVGTYGPDVHPVQLPASLPPGRYRIEVGLYDRASGTRLPVDRSTATAGGALVLGTLTVSAQ